MAALGRRAGLGFLGEPGGRNHGRGPGRRWHAGACCSRGGQSARTERRLLLGGLAPRGWPPGRWLGPVAGSAGLVLLGGTRRGRRRRESRSSGHAAPGRSNGRQPAWSEPGLVSSAGGHDRFGPGSRDGRVAAARERLRRQPGACCTAAYRQRLVLRRIGE